MSRIENIAKFAQKRDDAQMEKERRIEMEIEMYKERIKALKHRIDELLTVGNACMEHGIPIEGRAWGGHEGYDTNQFISNSWSHLVGFIKEVDMETRKPLPLAKVGVRGGGACHFDLETDGVRIDVSGEVLWVLKHFVEGFDEFETEFYKYVDKVTG